MGGGGEEDEECRLWVSGSPGEGGVCVLGAPSQGMRVPRAVEGGKEGKEKVRVSSRSRPIGRGEQRAQRSSRLRGGSAGSNRLVYGPAAGRPPPPPSPVSHTGNEGRMDWRCEREPESSSRSRGPGPSAPSFKAADARTDFLALLCRPARAGSAFPSRPSELRSLPTPRNLQT